MARSAGTVILGLTHKIEISLLSYIYLDYINGSSYQWCYTLISASSLRMYAAEFEFEWLVNTTLTAQIEKKTHIMAGKAR